MLASSCGLQLVLTIRQALVKDLADAVQAAKLVNDSRAQVLRAMEFKGRDAAQQLI